MALSVEIGLLAISIVINAALCQTSPEITALESVFQDKCLKMTGNTRSYEKFRTDAYETFKYFEYAVEFLTSSSDKFCKEERSNLIFRANELKNDLNVCLHKEERFIADLVKDTIVEVLHFLCHHNAQYSKSLFGFEGTRCIEALQKANTTDLENCFNRIFPPSKDYITQGEICDDITVARKCLERVVAVSCPTPSMKELNHVFFNYVSKPCTINASIAISANTHALSLTVLLGFIYIIN